MPRFKKFITENKGVVPRTIWLYDDVGHTQEATQELRKAPACFLKAAARHWLKPRHFRMTRPTSLQPASIRPVPVPLTSL